MLKRLYPLLLLVLLAACQGDTLRRTDFAIQGIDVSRYQLQVDWEVVADQGMHFAFVKATEGATHTDSLFAKNWDAMYTAGLRRGAYHFFRPQTPAIEQAEHFIRTVTLVEGDLPPVLDLEVLDRRHPTKVVASAREWLEIIETHYGVRPILYTGHKFYNKHLAGLFNEYPLWMARYSTDEPVPACGRDWQFWQYGNRGQLPGIKGHVDFNVFYGDWQQLEGLTFQLDTVLSDS